MNISVIIHGKQNFLSEERPDIYIELPDCSDSRINIVEFKIENKSFNFKIDYRNLNMVWISTNSYLHNMFRDFHLATQFTLYRENVTTNWKDKVENRWDDESKIMYVDC